MTTKRPALTKKRKKGLKTIYQETFFGFGPILDVLRGRKDERSYRHLKREIGEAETALRYLAETAILKKRLQEN